MYWNKLINNKSNKYLNTLIIRDAVLIDLFSVFHAYKHAAVKIYGIWQQRLKEKFKVLL